MAGIQSSAGARTVRRTQYGAIAIAGGTGSNTLDVTPVLSIDRSTLHYLGVSNIDDTTTQRTVTLRMLDENTVIAETAGNMANGLTVRFCLEDRY